MNEVDSNTTEIFENNSSGGQLAFFFHLNNKHFAYNMVSIDTYILLLLFYYSPSVYEHCIHKGIMLYT